MDYQNICIAAIEIIKETAGYIVSQALSFDSKKVESKGLHDYVSFVDKNSEKQLIAGLKQLVPDVGFIAEEMALVYPEVVGRDDLGMPSGIDYGKLSTILTAKIQEQQTIIEQLQSQVSTIMGLLQGSK